MHTLNENTFPRLALSEVSSTALFENSIQTKRTQGSKP